MANEVSPSRLTGEIQPVWKWNSRHLALAFALIDQQNLKSVDVREIVQWARGCTADDTKVPGLKRMVSQYDLRSMWVASEILSYPDSVNRGRTIKMWIETAWVCKEMHNFFAMCSILSGLCLTPVYRLRTDWANVSKSYKIKLQAMKTINGMTLNFKAYRALFNASLGKPQIPHLAVHLKDCYQAEQAFKDRDKTTNRISFKKYLSLQRLFRPLLVCQEHDYHLSKKDNQQALITWDRANKATAHVASEKGMTSEEMWKLSSEYHSTNVVATEHTSTSSSMAIGRTH